MRVLESLWTKDPVLKKMDKMIKSVMVLELLNLQQIFSPLNQKIVIKINFKTNGNSLILTMLMFIQNGYIVEKNIICIKPLIL